ncbi:proline--tRNA ligase [Candidatus Peregrinibacteria bacterium HGW-Peregrinibacteria-1]|jgi:prolyl-tRNA synthetase|nr:MAG: proline--tRNA ligase [Candidatus Peregrinibacteria bacterium HGW-Peregrinibacteria-1]
MRYSKFFGKTQKDVPSDAVFVSHQLLHKGGFIRESVAGRYFFLPLGQRVQNKLVDVIREEMDKAGAQEMLSPVLHPLSLWEETNRTQSAGFELMKIEDRRGAQFALGGTAEEMFVDVVRKFQISYKDLPFNIYQFSLKFRDELRARGGLFRVREFLMKDAYSFHKDEEDFKEEYHKMWEVYLRIFERLGLEALVVEADNGYIGGEYCHEFVVVSEAGESRFLKTADGKYAAHEDVAVFVKKPMNLEEDVLEMKEVGAVRGRTMADGVSFHGLPLWQQIKNVVFMDENNRMIVAVLRGDFEVNECKLKHLLKVHELRSASEEELVEKGLVAGFVSPVGLPKEVLLVADDSLRGVRNMYTGGGKLNVDRVNVNIDRDFTPALEGDFAMAESGFEAVGGGILEEGKGVEVGNIFQLGYHYSKMMKGAQYVSDKGQSEDFYMGCYGIGVGRTLATIVEKHNDDKGIVWPKSVAPFQVYLISIGKNSDDESIKKGEEIYLKLEEMGIEVLYDDRNESPGKKFGDADLIGIPLRVVVSSRSLENNEVEIKGRDEADSKMMKVDDFLATVTDLL